MPRGFQKTKDDLENFATTRRVLFELVNEPFVAFGMIKSYTRQNFLPKNHQMRSKLLKHCRNAKSVELDSAIDHTHIWAGGDNEGESDSIVDTLAKKY